MCSRRDQRDNGFHLLRQGVSQRPQHLFTAAHVSVRGEVGVQHVVGFIHCRGHPNPMIFTPHIRRVDIVAGEPRLDLPRGLAVGAQQRLSLSSGKMLAVILMVRRGHVIELVFNMFAPVQRDRQLKPLF